MKIRGSGEEPLTFPITDAVTVANDHGSAGLNGLRVVLVAQDCEIIV